MNIIDILKRFPQILKNPNFWMFFGTGLIVSVAYMDPGNWGTSISAGAEYNYTLLWAIWFSSAAAMLFQYLSGKLGIANQSIGDIIREKWKSKTAVFVYWLLAEIAILATDLAEFLGIVVALNLLFHIPYLEGAIIAVADVILLLALTKGRFRVLEYAFVFFVSIIGLGYIYELILTKPDASAIIAGSVTPALTPQTAILVVGIIGATVMPHALFVHSWLMKNKMNNQIKNKLDKKTVLEFHTVEVIISLVIASLVNAAILIMAASAFYKNSIAVATIEEAYKTLTPLFGSLASLVFGIALLSAGISSSITGTLSGQSILETLTDFNISPTVRRLITRFINIIPTVIALYVGIEPLQILVYSQVALSLLIPLPLIPLIYYTSKKDIMGDLVNKKITNIVSIIFALIIIAFNAYLIYQTFFA